MIRNLFLIDKRMSNIYSTIRATVLGYVTPKRYWERGTALQKNKTALNLIYFLNALLLVLHAGFLAFFFVNAVYVMVYVNIFSLLTYLINFQIISAGKLRVYMTSTFLEVMLHMFFAVLCVGLDSGFHLYFFGCIAVILYVEYLTVRLDTQPLNGLFLCFICGVLYFLSLITVKFKGPEYSVDSKMAFGCLLVNSFLILLFVALFFGIMTSRSRHYEQELANQALHDQLTGLYNRQYMVEYLDYMWSKGRTCNGWIAIVDVDDFKKVNDRYGHNSGDFVLESIGSIIRSVCTRQVNCRWGGEEFLIFGENQSLGQAEEVLEKLREAIMQHSFRLGNECPRITVTIGAQNFRESWSVDSWIAEADRKLYQGKCSGKNRVVS